MTRSQKLPWLEAQDECIKSGGDLATFKTSADKEFLKQFYSEEERFWVGGSDREVEDKWKWVDGQDMDRDLFSYGEPDGRNVQNCLAMKSHVMDLNFLKDLKYLCEYKSKHTIDEL